MPSSIYAVLLLMWLADVAFTTLGDLNVPLQLGSQDPESAVLLPVFNEVLSGNASIQIRWTAPYFPLRSLLLFGQDPGALRSIQLPIGEKNYTISNLEPGSTYKIVLELYYGTADLDKVTRYVSTQPIKPRDVKGDIMLELHLCLKASEADEKGLADQLLQKLSSLLSKHNARSIHVYSIRSGNKCLESVVYLTVKDNVMLAVFLTLETSLEQIGAERFGFKMQAFKACCKPFFYNAFDALMPWLDSDLLNLRVIPPSAFSAGKCSKSVNLQDGDILVQSRGRKHLDAITISVYLKLATLHGLQPIMSAVNFLTQLRLEVQEGRVVWMFYNLENREGFIISTSISLKASHWHHVLVDYSVDSGTARIFVDGAMNEKGYSHVQLSREWLLGLRVGKYFSGGMEYKMSGYLDDLHLYSCVLPVKSIEYLQSHCGDISCEKEKHLEGPKILIAAKGGRPTTSNLDRLTDWRPVDLKCEPAGTLKEQPANTPDGQCTCKANVVGKLCDTCKLGTFNLQHSNAEGCMHCFCNNLTRDCRSAKLERSPITITAKDIRNINLRSLDGRYKFNKELVYNPITNVVKYQTFGSTISSNVLYWDLPLRYCGDKIGSYGGYLRYTISYMSNLLDRPLRAPDVTLKGSDIEVHYMDPGDALPGQKYHYQVILEEQFWKLSSGGPVSRPQFLSALADIDSLLLRASFSTEMIETSLHEVSMDVAGFDPATSSDAVAPMVEECKCPAEYFGTSCQYCNKGYAKSRESVGKCVPCQCNGHATDCDGQTGECRNCEHFTTGMFCERCLAGYYGDPRSGRSDACQPCACPLSIDSNKFSSTCVLDNDGQPTCDACKSGHTGRRCEQCVSPYVGDPTKPGDYCKVESDTKCGDCDVRGSVDLRCDKDGRCACKGNVEGPKCDRCKDSHFHLSSDNEEGCLKCWCSGVAKVCGSANYFRSSLTMDGWTGSLRLTDIDEGLDIRQGYYSTNRNELVFTSLDTFPDQVLYWSLPSRFLGSKLSSYGGTLKYTVSYDAAADGVVLNVTDIKITGAQKILTFRSDELVAVRQVKTREVKLKERFWLTTSGEEATRDDILSVLVNIKSILIRATYNTASRISAVGGIEITDSGPFDMGGGMAPEVERCSCPEGYSGLSCETCTLGYFPVKVDAAGYSCQPCRCNGHSNLCNSETGVCLDCQHNTQGDQCQDCKPGYYGDARNDSCKPCACPLHMKTNQFSPTCYLDKDGIPTCDACARGYAGRDCGSCASGYTGNPSVPGGKCLKSALSVEVMPSVEVTPSRRRDRLGTTATFRCQVRGSEPLTIQWSRLDGRPLPNRATIFSRPGNVQVLQIRNLKSIDEEVYVCTGTNGYGLTNGRAPLSVIDWDLKPINVNVAPQSLRIDEGATARFMCSASSEATFTVEWSKEDGPLPPDATAVGGVLAISNVQTSHSGLYTCTGSNQFSTDRVTVSLRVGETIEPQVSVEPPYQTVDIGASLKFRCLATGYPRPSISWERAPGKSLPASASVSGAILRIGEAQLGDEGDYFCLVQNRGGKATRKAVLYVRGPDSAPKVTVVPSELAVRPGDVARFLCSTDGKSVSNLQWRKENGSMPITSTVRGGQLTVRRVDVLDEGKYVCVASNAYGSIEVFGRLKVLREPGTKPKTVLAPSFTRIAQGSSGHMNCSVTGDPPPIVMWSRPNGLLTRNHVVDGETLHILDAGTDDSGMYVCSAENRLGLDSATAVVSVERRAKPKVLVTPAATLSVSVGDKASFTCCVVDGEPHPALSWKTEQGYRVSASHLRALDGCLILVFEQASQMDNGSYICDASNMVGSHEVAVNLSVKGDPRVAMQPRGTYHVVAGEKVVVECFGFGLPLPKLQLTMPKKVHEASDRNMSLLTNEGYLRMELLVMQNYGGVYSCTGENQLGKRHDWIHLMVSKSDVLPVVTILPAHITVNVGSDFKVLCSAYGVPQPNVSWVRGKDDVVLSWSEELAISGAKESDAGNYYCNAVNREGRGRGSALVEVVAPLSAAISPASVVIKEGSPFNLKCIVGGTPLPSVTWSRLNADLPATAIVSPDGDVEVLSATLDDAGSYVCTAKNTVGEERSVANVSIVNPPTILSSNPRVVHVNLTDNVTFTCEASGYPLPDITWRHPPKSTGRPVSTNMFMIDKATRYDQGQYRCRASNAGGITERTYVLSINDIPKVHIEGGIDVRIFEVGSSASLSCIGRGNPQPHLSWSKVDGTLPVSASVKDGVLNISNMVTEYSGRYRCLGANSFGSVISEAVILVQGAPVLTVPSRFLKVNLFESVKLACSARGSPQPTISWYKLNGKMPLQHYVKATYMQIPRVSKYDGGVYVCRAENSGGFVEELVELKVMDYIPRFSSEGSLIVFDRIQKALYKTRVQVTFQAYKPFGLLLYNSDGQKDFVSVGLVDGFVVFQYNLGSGNAYVKSKMRIRLAEWETVEAVRDGFNGLLRVSSQPQVAGRSPGKFTGLNLQDDLYVGGFYNATVLQEQTGHNSSLDGCISQVIVNGEILNIVESSLKMVNVSPCEACSKDICHNGGECEPSASSLGFACKCGKGWIGRRCENRLERCYPGACLHEGECVNENFNGFRCKCALGRHGTRCENGVLVSIPAFGTSSILTFAVPHSLPRAFFMSVTFKLLTHENGVLIFVGDDRSPRRRFVEMHLTRGKLQLLVSIYNDSLLLEYPKELRIGDWIKIYVEQQQQHVSMVIDGGEAVKARLKGYHRSLGLTQESVITLGKRHAAVRSFTGCIRELVVNSKRVALDKDYVSESKISSCHTAYSPCQSNSCNHNSSCGKTGNATFTCLCSRGYTGKLCETPLASCGLHEECKNGGKCVPRQSKDGSVACRCPLGFNGASCETRNNVSRSAIFSGSSYVVYNNSYIRSAESTEISFSIRTNQSDGLLFWYGQVNHSFSPDYLTVALRKGRVEVGCSLGSGVLNLIGTILVNNDSFCDISIRRAGSHVSLHINGRLDGETHSSLDRRGFNIKAPIFIGGSDDVSQLTRLTYEHGFMGCMKDLKIDGNNLDFFCTPVYGYDIAPCDN